MDEQKPPTIPVSALALHAGDVFERHGRTWTVEYSGPQGPYSSVLVAAKEGTVYMSRAAVVDVWRKTRVG